MGVQKSPAAYLAGWGSSVHSRCESLQESARNPSGDDREIPSSKKQRCGTRPLRSLDEFPLSSTGPRIICQAEPDSVGNGGMIVEQENIHAVRIGVRQIHFAQYLESLRRYLPGIRRQPMRHFQSVLVRLMLQITAKRGTDRIYRKRKD